MFGTEAQIHFMQNLPHKMGVDSNDWERMDANIFPIMEYVMAYARPRNLPIMVTSLIRGKIPGISMTDIHAKARAVDLSRNGWAKQYIYELRDLVNEKFRSIAAIGEKTGLPIACVYHDGTDWHFHFQCRRSV